MMRPALCRSSCRLPRWHESSPRRLARLPADSPVVELHQIRQVLALPAAECKTALAPGVDAVGESYLQNRFFRPVGNLHDPQRERMEIQEQPSVPDQAAAGNVAIA